MFEPVMTKYKDEILENLEKLVAIESVAVPECKLEGYPFGRQSADALEFMTHLAGSLGFATGNCGNFACHAQLGEGGDEDYAAVLCHVDVVPTGQGWDTDPLTLTEKDGILYGRGVADDKGAAMVALYCMKAMKDNCVSMKRPIRCIFGGGEEIGMDDMGHYFSKHALPTVAFTPDADYPACNCEKGILHLKLTGRTDPAILSVKGGSAINCVADSCTAVINCDEHTAKATEAIVNAGDAECTVAPAETGFAITVKGKSAHAMCPENGVNAVNCLLTAAGEAGVLTEGSAEYFFAQKLCRDCDGKAIGAACSDEMSGQMTLNVGLIESAGGQTSLSIDIRYPATLSSQPIISRISGEAADAGLSLEVIGDNPPLYVPADHPLIQALGECFTEVTGKPMVPVSMGGGTYARALHGRGVAFGPVFSDAATSNLHMANENLPLENFMLHAEICYRAMCRIASLDCGNE
ncbi:MAG: Sapep family Mn(2+)-dependent dipeptidase [Clostridia bacterium]|nr:Sapep family Mn(2+)-dependent dipeptidase [Clostridia bacterium]